MLNMRKYIFIVSLVFLGLGLSAQNIKEVPEIKAGKSINHTIYVTAVKKSGNYTVKVINPQGELQTTPILNKFYQANARINIDLDTQFWKKGTYTILVEDEEAHLIKKKEWKVKK